MRAASAPMRSEIEVAFNVIVGIRLTRCRLGGFFATDGNATDFRAEFAQTFFNAFVAAINVVNSADAGFALGGESGDHQRSAGA